MLIVGPDGLPVGQRFAGPAGDDEGEGPRELPVTEMVGGLSECPSCIVQPDRSLGEDSEHEPSAMDGK